MTESPSSSAAGPAKPIIIRQGFSAFQVMCLLVLTLIAGIFARPVALATSKSIALLKTPATALALATGQTTRVPLADGPFCNITVQNNSANPVYWGGPPPGANGTSTAGITVNTANGQPFCTDTAVCPAGATVSINVTTNGIGFIQASGGPMTIRYELGEGCSS